MAKPKPVKLSGWENGAKQIGDFLGAANKSWSGGAKQLGDFFNSTNPSWARGAQQAIGHQPQPVGGGPGQSTNSGRRTAAGQGGDPAGRAARLAALNTPAPEPTHNLSDFLQQALGMLGGGQGLQNAYEQQVQATRDQAANADSQLSAMYAQLQAQYASALPQVQQNYAQAGQQIQGASDAATNDATQAYQAADAQQNSVLNALGIGNEARGVLASNGNYAANDQAHALSSIAANRGANLNANSENKATAEQYNRGMGQAAQLGGATARSQVAQKLVEKLSALQGSYAQQQQSSMSNAMSMAQALSSDYWSQQDRATSAAHYADQQQQNAAKIALQQAQAQYTQQKPQMVIDSLNQFLAQTGQKPNPTEMARILASMGTAYR